MTYPVGFDAFVDPDIAMSYRNLADPFTSRVPIAITNTWTATLYFRATLIGPPAAYSNYISYLGSVAPGSSAYKIWQFDRAKPSARTTDDLLIELRAYTDAAYTNTFGYADLSCKYHLFDHEALTQVAHDNFDDATQQGWALYGSGGIKAVVSDIYLTAPYSLRFFVVTSGFPGGVHKSYTIGSVTRAFLVLHMRYLIDAKSRIYLGTTLKMPEQAQPPTNKWFRLCFFMPINQATDVRLLSEMYPGYDVYNWLDEVWVVSE